MLCVCTACWARVRHGHRIVLAGGSVVCVHGPSTEAQWIRDTVHHECSVVGALLLAPLASSLPVPVRFATFPVVSMATSLAASSPTSRHDCSSVMLPFVSSQSPDGTVRHAACIPMCTRCRIQCRQPLYRRGVPGVFCSAACIDECDPSVPRCYVCSGVVTGEASCDIAAYWRNPQRALRAKTVSIAASPPPFLFALPA